MRIRPLTIAALLALSLALSGCGASGTGQVTATAPAPPKPKPKTADPAMPSAAEQVAAMKRFAGGHRPIYCGGRRKPWVAFTFDDGPGPYTRKMLALLRRNDIPATFFVVGRNVKPNSRTLKAEHNYHAPIGDHSWSHPLLTSLPAGQQRSQLLTTKSAIERTTGERVQLFRPPYGARNATTDQLSRRAGMATILWNVDSQDALGASHKKIARLVKHGLTPGSIVLMHENHGQTLRALRYTIIPALKHRKIKLVTVPQMLAGNPPTQAQLSRGRKGCRR